MTTGNTGEQWLIGPFSSYRYGNVRFSNWSGQDAITPTTPRSSYPLVKDMPGPTAAQARLNRIQEDIEAVAKLPPGPDRRKRLQALKRMRKHAIRDLASSKDRERQIRAEQRALRRAQSAELRRRRRLLPPKPYTKAVTHRVTPGVVGRHSSWGSGIPDQLFAAGAESLFSPLSVTMANLPQEQRNKLLAKLQKKAYGSGFNPVVFLAEGRKALDMIFNAAYSIRMALDACRRGNLKAACYYLRVTPQGVRSRESWYNKEMSNRWLELQYGWLPLIKDVKDGAEFLAEAVNQPYKYRDKLVARKVYALHERSPSTSSRYYARRVITVQHQIIIYNYSKVANGVGFYGVAEAAWEVLPWSFVYDWFVPVGSLLASLKTASLISGTVVETVKLNAIYLEPTSYGSGYVVKSTMLPLGESQEEMYIKRTVAEDIKPLSSATAVKDSISNLKEALSWRRAANAVALLTQRAYGSRSS